MIGTTEVLVRTLSDTIKLTMHGVLDNTEVLVFTMSDTTELSEQVLGTTEVLAFTLSDTIEFTVFTMSECWTPLMCWHSQ